MTNKTKQIAFCIGKILDILDEIRPNNNWEIDYDKPEKIMVDEWKKQYLQLIDGEDYFFIYIDDDLTYAVNVTGDSVLTAVHELMAKIAAKF